tara:strand:+ start:959 stop:2266 length:1308 start_codon:yes stop_codon:yes gene_type:complete
MKKLKNIFLGKKILIYGLGSSGISTYKFLKKKADVYLFDDNPKINFKIKQKIGIKEVEQTKFDRIIVSPGIDLSQCKLSNFLSKNFLKISTDLDIFYEFFKNDCITITGTNGKSTTCQLLYQVLKNQYLDVKLVGNIGKPILSIKNVKKKTIFVIEASSYQLDYSKNFRSKYAVILNISPDHIERHKTLKKYIQAKFKLLKNQKRGSLAFVKKEDTFINIELKRNNFKGKIIKINTSRPDSFLENIKNRYFMSETNKQNLLFVKEICKFFSVKKKVIVKTINNFKGLKYRQQIIYKKDNLTIINDSKSTSFSSSIGILKENSNIYWILGGMHKSGDQFKLPKKYFSNIRAFIYGKNKNFFIKKLKKKIKYKNFVNLKQAVKRVFEIVKKNKIKKQTIIFSPCAASFDSFKNFEDRGQYFDKLIKDQLYGKYKIIL